MKITVFTFIIEMVNVKISGWESNYNWILLNLGAH